MKRIFTFLIACSSITAFAQQPSWLGTNVGDGITYTEYTLFDHGVVSSYRMMAQNSVSDTSLEWNFITAAADYSINWRPYTVGQVYGPFNTIVDPTVDDASAKYNTAFGGQPCAMSGIQAGFFYTFVIENNETADNKMCINETAFDPVVMDTIYHDPVIPTDNDMVTFTVELDGSMMPSIGEHVFIRYSIDGFANSEFVEITNFSGGVGTATVAAFPADTTVVYYALSTAEAVPDAATIDYYTLFFGNNVNQNYQFTVSSITSIEEDELNVQIRLEQNQLRISALQKPATVLILDMNGRVVLEETSLTNSVISVSQLSKGTYVCSIDGKVNRRFVIN